MLCRLAVENYALIERLTLDLDARLNIVTGETGAGKSILLGALGLLLGARSDTEAILDTTRNCTVEGTFRLEGLRLEAFFEENDLDYAAETTITRILTPAGKNRAFVNDTPVPLAVLRDLGSRLIDIHSQHRNLILSSPAFRLSALDTFAGNGPLVEEYAARYERMTSLRQRLASLREEAARNSRDEEWLRYQTEELSAAALRAGEQAELEAELALLEHAESIGTTLGALREAFDADEQGVLAQLKRAEGELMHLRDHYPAAGEYAARIRSALEELKDISASAAADSERIDTDPARLAQCSARLDTLLALQQKHRAADEAALIALRDRYAEQLAAIEHGDEAIAAAEGAFAEAEAEAAERAGELRRAREQAAPAFGERIEATLTQLGMPGARFRAALETAPLGPTGGDEAAFLFSANEGAEPRSVERIASGGELSRVMLALKALLAERMKLPTIIFDEIDTGVSGRIADAMGEIIARLSGTMQVVDITHLPQVASKGDAHFLVRKQEGRTVIERLTTEERVVEIAKMLSGAHTTDAALAQARILLGKG